MAFDNTKDTGKDATKTSTDVTGKTNASTTTDTDASAKYEQRIAELEKKVSDLESSVSSRSDNTADMNKVTDQGKKMEEWLNDAKPRIANNEIQMADQKKAIANFRATLSEVLSKLQDAVQRL